MNARTLSRHYVSLSPGERFRLILAASARDDRAERERLVAAGRTVQLTVQDHAPYAHALGELAKLFYLALLEDATAYRDALAADDDREKEDGPSYMVLGFFLRARAEGWKLFCDRQSIEPFLFWRHLPGFDRLRRALALAEDASFVPEGFVRWLNRGRPEGAPERTDLPDPYTPEAMADALEGVYRERVAWWGGERE